MFLNFPRKVTCLGVLSLMALNAPQIADAQVAEAALAEARVRLACGGGTPVSAVYLPSGAIEVTCRANAPRRAVTNSAAVETARQNPLGGTGLATAPAAGVLATAVILGIVVGDGGENTTTTEPSSVDVEPQ
ncbi:hypothetical protein KMP13_09730 [Epibacterium ulvae]|uniref:hypothetical protein n=1 Tax=Epibacterium ulvae TaxID=1156985 RepID=UPI001BFC9FC6|nr:hypothetical protein [Epibacterium ulvae]MBT8154169.1 hypothetical protein [Epibacterium ulvae]